MSTPKIDLIEHYNQICRNQLEMVLDVAKTLRNLEKNIKLNPKKYNSTTLDTIKNGMTTIESVKGFESLKRELLSQIKESQTKSSLLIDNYGQVESEINWIALSCGRIYDLYMEISK